MHIWAKIINSILITFLMLFQPALSFVDEQQQQILAISPQIALPIGIKIWFNESGGSLLGLTSWNDGESFASLGIGHFTWQPRNNSTSYYSGFPRLIRYMEQRGINVPYWIRGENARFCPWNNRYEFLQAQYSPRMIELRRFLQETIPIQAEYMTHHLEEILPEILANTPPSDRPFVCNQFYTLARTPAGIYALVDYLNFKGPGTGGKSPYSYITGSGLLQVLQGMKYAPAGSTPLQAYVWSAKNALIRRVENASPSRHHERWLGGWFKRLNTYLETDLGEQQEVGQQVAMR